MTQRVNWRQVFAEVGLLFLGAMVAVSADSMWDDRRERVEEAQYLSAIREDLLANRTALEADYRDIPSANSLLLSHVQGIEIELSPDSLTRVAMRAFTMGYFRPALGTYRDMIGSGSLRLIRDNRVREGLASFDEEVEVLQAAISALFNRWNMLEEPFIIAHLPAVAIYDGYPRGLLPDVEGRMGQLKLPRSDSDAFELPRTVEFANLLTLRMVLLFDVLIAVDFLRQELDQVTISVGEAASDSPAAGRLEIKFEVQHARGSWAQGTGRDQGGSSGITAGVAAVVSAFQPTTATDAVSLPTPLQPSPNLSITHSLISGSSEYR